MWSKPIDKKIAEEEKTFTENSQNWNEHAQKVTLKEIHDNANWRKPVVHIAVTRQQYNFERFHIIGNISKML